MPHRQHKVQSMSAAFQRIKISLINWKIRLYQSLSKKVNPTATAFHAVDRGSNPLGDAKIRYDKGYQCAKHIGILSFFVSTRFPVVHVCPVASNSCRGISEGRSMLCKSVIPSRITGLYCCIFLFWEVSKHLFLWRAMAAQKHFSYISGLLT